MRRLHRTRTAATAACRACVCDSVCISVWRLTRFEVAIMQLLADVQQLVHFGLREPFDLSSSSGQGTKDKRQAQIEQSGAE